MGWTKLPDRVDGVHLQAGIHVRLAQVLSLCQATSSMVCTRLQSETRCEAAVHCGVLGGRVLQAHAPGGVCMASLVPTGRSWCTPVGSPCPPGTPWPWWSSTARNLELVHAQVLRPLCSVCMVSCRGIATQVLG